MLILAAFVLASVVCGNLVYPVLAPSSGQQIGQAYADSQQPETIDVKTDTPEVTPTDDLNPTPSEELDPTQSETKAPEPTLTPITLPTQGVNLPISDDNHLLYYTIAGDSLPVVSLHFGVDMSEITSPDPLKKEGLLPPGQLLIIPNTLEETSSKTILLSDSEVTFSPSTIDFDIQGYIDEAGGYLSTYKEWLKTTEWTTGADIIARVALEYSVNPRLLLAFLEYKSGWVFGEPDTQSEITYPMGYENPMKHDLYLQSAWFAGTVMQGYYGWREGRKLLIVFSDGNMVRLAPELNAGSIGLMNVFSYLYSSEDWDNSLYGEDNFFDLHERMFSNPWIRAEATEPLIPADTLQPEMILPFEVGHIWNFVAGPHAAWSSADVWAALDFAPAGESGCLESNAWVVASIPGLVVRSENGVVVIDMDGDGYEQTGWTLLYLHIAEKDRIPLGTWVEVGDRIGHPSCEGGRSQGTHVHMARRYNGEWVPADGPLPFTLSGWVARAGTEAYKGWLIRDNEIIYANTSTPFETLISRDD
jgi:hypothetical protein